jgi:hypothetical protein
MVRSAASNANPVVVRTVLIRAFIAAAGIFLNELISATLALKRAVAIIVCGFHLVLRSRPRILERSRFKE